MEGEARRSGDRVPAIPELVGAGQNHAVCRRSLRKGPLAIERPPLTAVNAAPPWSTAIPPAVRTRWPTGCSLRRHLRGSRPNRSRAEPVRRQPPPRFPSPARRNASSCERPPAARSTGRSRRHPPWSRSARRCMTFRSSPRRSPDLRSADPRDCVPSLIGAAALATGVSDTNSVSAASTTSPDVRFIPHLSPRSLQPGGHPSVGVRRHAGTAPAIDEGSIAVEGVHQHVLIVRRSGQQIGRDPDLLDHTSANLEHRRRVLLHRQVPRVQANLQRCLRMQHGRSRGDRLAGTHAVDRVERVRGRRPHNPIAQRLTLLRGQNLQQLRRAIPNPDPIGVKQKKSSYCLPRSE